MSDERTLEIIDAYAADLRDLSLKFALALHDARGLRIHRGWVASAELADIARAASDAAVRSVIASDWGDFSAEVLFLYGPKQEAERVAAE